MYVYICIYQRCDVVYSWILDEGWAEWAEDDDTGTDEVEAQGDLQLAVEHC